MPSFMVPQYPHYRVHHNTTLGSRLLLSSRRQGSDIYTPAYDVLACFVSLHTIPWLGPLKVPPVS